jgi:hypothetical protein
MARRRLIRAAKALLDDGIVPPGVSPVHQRVRAASIVLPQEQPDPAAEYLKVRDGERHASV